MYTPSGWRVQPIQKEQAMSDNLHRYRAIREALIQGYRGELHGRGVRHLTTLAALISGIVGGKSTQLPHIATKVPDGTKPESRVKRFTRWLDNDRILEEVYFLPYAALLLTHLALETLVLVMDGSVVGRDCTALMIHVIYKGRALPLAWRVRQGPKGHFPEDLHIAVVELMREVIPDKPGHDILAIRGDLRRPDLKEKSLPLRTENPLFFSYIIISGHRSMRLKPGRLNAPPAERVSWPGLHWHAGSGRRAHGRGHGRSRGGRVPHHPPRANGSDPEVHYRDHRWSRPGAAAPRSDPNGLHACTLPR